MGDALRRPSTTAERAAVLRAAHQLLDRPSILEDPIALRLIGAERAAALRADPQPFDTPAARRLRASIAIRSRYAEDCLRDAVRRGVRRYVVLGAGLDSFAWRNPFPGLRIYEVDQPATQAWKRQRRSACRSNPVRPTVTSSSRIAAHKAAMPTRITA